MGDALPRAWLGLPVRPDGEGASRRERDDGRTASKVYEYYYLRNRLRLVHDTSRLTRRQLIAANWRGSAATVAASLRTKGGETGSARRGRSRSPTSTSLRDRYGQFERL